MPITTASLCIDEFQASILLDGRRLTCYKPKNTRTVASCWVASEANKTFSVEFDRGDFERCKLLVVLSIDGKEVDTRVQFPDDEGTHCFFEHVEAKSGWKVFQFAAIDADDLSVGADVLDNLHDAASTSTTLVADIGTIELKVHRVANLRTRSDGKFVGEDARLQLKEELLAAPKIGSRALESVCHRVKFIDKWCDDAEEPGSSDDSDSDSDSNSDSDCDSKEHSFDKKECLAKFVFRYRPYEVLKNFKVASVRRRDPPPSSEPAKPDAVTRPQRVFPASSSSTTKPSVSVPTWTVLPKVPKDKISNRTKSFGSSSRVNGNKPAPDGVSQVVPQTTTHVVHTQAGATIEESVSTTRGSFPTPSPRAPHILLDGKSTSPRPWSGIMDSDHGQANDMDKDKDRAPLPTRGGTTLSAADHSARKRGGDDSTCAKTAVSGQEAPAQFQPLSIKRETIVSINVESRGASKAGKNVPDSAADEDLKQDKWGLDRLGDLLKRKRKRAHNRKVKGTVIDAKLDEDEEDDEDDEMMSILSKLTQSNKKRRMQSKAAEIVDLSWI